MPRHSALKTFRFSRLLRLFAILLIAVAGSAGLLFGEASRKANGRSGEVAVGEDPAPVDAQKKYSKFSHAVPEHRKTCSDCHTFPSANWEKVRSEGEAFPDITDYPQHQSCLNCHKKQFFSGPKPAICTNCHTDPSPRNSNRHPFPNPREAFDESPKGKSSFSAFSVNFPHDFHVAMMGSNNPGERSSESGFFVNASFERRSQSDTCAMCHQLQNPAGDSPEEYLTPLPEDLGDAFWLKKGTFMTSPTGHSQCFTCHSADGGLSPAPSDCGICHKLIDKPIDFDFDAALPEKMKIDDKLTVASWKRRNSSGTFRHEWFSHADMDCTQCHSLDGMNTADLTVKRVSITACSGCHITETSDDGGILNYELDSRRSNPKFTCVKCHVAFGKMKIPETHPKAIEALAGN